MSIMQRFENMLSLSKKKLPKYSIWTAAFLVAAITFVVFLPALQNGFVNIDDHLYVYENPAIRSIDIVFMKWSLTAVVASLWHPLTLFSLALDYAVWGMNPYGYHLTNIILHALNTILVFVLVIQVLESAGLREGAAPSLTRKELYIATATAFLFGIHPLRVESVAWISERKDVLCAFFFLLTILSYIKYTSSLHLKKTILYLISFIFFFLALLSKPMAVTLPIILLLLDFYPLKRSGLNNIKWVLLEKIPFFILSALSSLLTLWAHASGGTLLSVDVLPFQMRIVVALRAVLFYLYKMLLPFNLAPFYPYPETMIIFSVETISALILFPILTFIAIRSLKWNRLFFSVWFYYLIMLFPVIGIAQVGGQAAADRYTYLPSLGPFLLAGIGIGIVLEKYSKKRARLLIFATLLTISIILCHNTIKQIAVWHDSITLWSHDIKFFPETAFSAYDGRGTEYGRLGKYQDAIKDFDMAIKINPEYLELYYNRGITFEKMGETLLAKKDFEKVIKNAPQFKEAYYRLGLISARTGNDGLALFYFRKAASLGSKEALAYLKKGENQ